MQIIAHRGASGYEPENTLASFEKAIELGADMIELDVYVLKSGELVVIHDSTVNRTTNGSGHVTRFTLEELRRLDAGNGQKIPLLREVFDLVDKRVAINIELKGAHTAHPVAQLLTEYMTIHGWSANLFLVSSFKHAELQQFMWLLPNIHAGALYKSNPNSLSLISHNRHLYATNLNASFVNTKSVDTAHSRGTKVYVYTVNTPAEAARMQAMHVDGIFTNYPDPTILQLAST